MGKPLSMDLRSRTLVAVDEGMRCLAAARRFEVAARDGDPLVTCCPSSGPL